MGVVAVALAAMSGQGVALADSSAEELPPTWHIHDGGSGLAAQADLLLPDDPRHQRGDLPAGSGALPERNRQSASPQRHGEQQRSDTRRRLRDEHDGHPPTNRPNGYRRTEGWQSLTTTTERDWVTYYLVTPR